MSGIGRFLRLLGEIEIAALPIFAVGLTIGIPANAWWPTVSWMPYGIGAGIGLALAVVGTWRASRRPSRAGPRGYKGALGLAVLLALGIGSGTTGLLLAINGGLDVAPPRGHTTEVVDKSTTSSGGWRSYSLELRPWRAGTATVDVDVSEEMYERLEPRQSLRVTTGPGLLGWEHVVDLAVPRDTSPGE